MQCKPPRWCKLPLHQFEYYRGRLLFNFHVRANLVLRTHDQFRPALHLERVLEADLPFNWLGDGAAVHLSILGSKVQRVDPYQSQNKELQPGSHPKSRDVARSVLLSENRACDNPSDGSKTNLESTPDGSLALHSNVVTLVREDCRDVSLTPRDTEKEAKVPYSVGLVICCDHEPDNRHNRLERNNGATEVVLVSNPSQE